MFPIVDTASSNVPIALGDAEEMRTERIVVTDKISALRGKTGEVDTRPASRVSTSSA